MTSCREFRARLAAALEAGALAEPDAHLALCGACRGLLAEEQALELVLASWPRPALPRDLARRVLARLADAREPPHGADGLGGLDRLLESADVPAAPADLGRRTLERLAVAREFERLDRLLERVPPPEVPPGLARAVLARVETERRPVLARIIARPPFSRFSRTEVLASAAVVLVLLALAWLSPRQRSGSDAEPIAAHVPAEHRPAPQVEGEPPAELLAALDLLEDWELLVDEGDALDVLLHAPVESEVLMLELERWSEADRTGDAPPSGVPSAPEGKG